MGSQQARAKARLNPPPPENVDRLQPVLVCAPFSIPRQITDTLAAAKPSGAKKPRTAPKKKANEDPITSEPQDVAENSKSAVKQEPCYNYSDDDESTLA
jgi:hypothetical protein